MSTLARTKVFRLSPVFPNEKTWPLRKRAGCALARLAVVVFFVLLALLALVGKLAWDSIEREVEP